MHRSRHLSNTVPSTLCRDSQCKNGGSVYTIYRTHNSTKVVLSPLITARSSHRTTRGSILVNEIPKILYMAKVYNLD